MKNNTGIAVEQRLYTVSDVAKMLKVSSRKAYDICNTTKDFQVVRLGRSVRVRKESFDSWFDSL